VVNQEVEEKNNKCSRRMAEDKEKNRTAEEKRR
jgi:hypothetical protein